MSGIWSVKDLNNYVSNLMETDPILSAVTVRGEISGFKKYPSGHWYFTLKDKEAQVNCVAFRGNASQINFNPENGSAVVIKARATLYGRDGRFQLVVYTMEREGVGDLHAAFEKLKARLSAEGLFDPAHKKPLPFLPNRIGVVSSPKGAVIQDIIHVLSRRFPNFNLLLYPSAVQGESAAKELAAGIAWFNQKQNVDVIIVARGGGSMEDLWCFNDEFLARQIFASQIPIISAVGHETDFTICDFVSDMRAPTPSAAAEIVMPVKNELLLQINRLEERLSKNLLHQVTHKRNRLLQLSASQALRSPLRRLEAESQRLDTLTLKLQHGLSKQQDSAKSRLGSLIAGLDALSPLKVLKRGYSLASDIDTKHCITSINQVEVGQNFSLQLADGQLACEVLAKSEVGKHE